MQKLIIEVSMNELMAKEDNPNVPYSPAEIADDAVACVEVGASILHFHARHPETGEQEWTNASRYQESLREIRERGVTRDVLFYPTYKGLDEQSLAHVATLAQDGDVRLAMAALDVGAVNLNKYDPITKEFADPSRAKAFSHQEMTFFYELCRANGIRPYNGCAEPGHIRHTIAYLDKGLLEEPLLFKFFTSEYAPFGVPPTAKGVQMYADVFAEVASGVELQWFISCYGQAILPMAAQAIVLGGHVRIGLGDETFKNAGCPTNVDLVRRIVEMAHATGREVATPRQARTMMGLPQYEDWGSA